MKTTTLPVFLLTIFLVTGFFSQSGSAQMPKLFGGQGIASSNDQAESRSGVQWPRLMDFSNDENPDESRFRLFGQNRDSFWKSSATAEPQSRKSWFSGFPSLIPERDPNAPTMLEKMNERSKNFVDRTTDWAAERNQNLRARTANTWDTMTRGLRPSQPAGERLRAPDLGGPPMRAADNVDSQNSVRF